MRFALVRHGSLSRYVCTTSFSCARLCRACVTYMADAGIRANPFCLSGAFSDDLFVTACFTLYVEPPPHHSGDLHYSLRTLVENFAQAFCLRYVLIPRAPPRWEDPGQVADIVIDGVVTARVVPSALDASLWPRCTEAETALGEVLPACIARN